MKVMTKHINFIKFSKLYNWSVNHILEQDFGYNQDFPLVKIGKFLLKNTNTVMIDNRIVYKRVTVGTNNGGVRLRNTEMGENIGTKRQFVVKQGQFILSKIDARNGAMGLIPNELDGAIVTNDFPTYDIDTSAILPQFLLLITTTKKFIDFAQSCSSGTTNRQRINLNKFLEVQIPLPPLDEADAKAQGLSTDITQEKLVADYNKKIEAAAQAQQNVKAKEAEIEAYLYEQLGIEKTTKSISKGLNFIRFKNLDDWSTKQTDTGNLLQSSLYDNVKIRDIAEVNPSTSFTKLDEDMEASFIPMANISDTDGEVTEYSLGKVGLSKGYTKFKDGDLLWARITPCMQNGKSAIVEGMQNGIGYGSTEYHRIRTEDKILTKYIHLLLRNKQVLSTAKNYFTGSSGQQRVPKSFLENLSIPLPTKEIMKGLVDDIRKKENKLNVLISNHKP